MIVNKHYRGQYGGCFLNGSIAVGGGEFTEKTVQIIEKYKTECNPKNKRLVLVDSKCDETAKKIDSHAYGGYICGDDGKWSSTCVISHCEEGYHFDYMNQKCIIDPCNPPDSETIPSKSESSSSHAGNNTETNTTETSSSHTGNSDSGTMMKNLLFMIMMIMVLMI